MSSRTAPSYESTTSPSTAPGRLMNGKGRIAENYDGTARRQFFKTRNAADIFKVHYKPPPNGSEIAREVMEVVLDLGPAAYKMVPANRFIEVRHTNLLKKPKNLVAEFNGSNFVVGESILKSSEVTEEPEDFHTEEKEIKPTKAVSKDSLLKSHPLRRKLRHYVKPLLKLFSTTYQVDGLFLLPSKEAKNTDWIEKSKGDALPSSAPQYAYGLGICLDRHGSVIKPLRRRRAESALMTTLGYRTIPTIEESDQVKHTQTKAKSRTRKISSPVHINLQTMAGLDVSACAAPMTALDDTGLDLAFWCPKIPLTALSNLPLFFTSSDVIYYFEVKIITLPKPSFNPDRKKLRLGDDAVLAIGLACAPYPQFRLPGWNEYSIGFHSDGGRKYIYNKSDVYGDIYYRSGFGEGDIVGCGYEPKDGKIFFTINGVKLPTVRKEKRPWHAAVGVLGIGVRIEVNMGAKPFLFGLANGGLNEVEADVVDYSSPPLYQDFANTVIEEPAKDVPSQPMLSATKSKSILIRKESVILNDESDSDEDVEEIDPPILNLLENSKLKGKDRKTRNRSMSMPHDPVLAGVQSLPNSLIEQIRPKTKRWERRARGNSIPAYSLSSLSAEIDVLSSAL